MNNERYHHQAGYEQGFLDGKRTNGKINNKYVENLFLAETQNLTEQESLLYTMGWRDGFEEAVRKKLKKEVRQESFFEKHLDKIYDKE